MPQTAQNVNNEFPQKDIIRGIINAGCLCLPAKSNTKRPDGIKWSKFKAPISLDQFNNLKNGFDGVCIITGQRSGNLEVIDFDKKIDPKVFNELLGAYKDLVESEVPGLFEKLAIEKSQSGGRHIFYKCSEMEIPGNQELAFAKVAVDGPGKHEYYGNTYPAKQDLDGQWCIYPCVIETRGEGGLIVCYPTPGYELTQGDIEQIPDISSSERDILIRCSEAFTQFFEPAQVVTGGQKLSSDELRPGDDFTQRGDILPTLEKHGWVIVSTVGIRTRIRRPGKPQGWSATLTEGKVFYVFSTNTEFEVKKPYSIFAVYAMLEHGSDFKAAAKDLAAQGYGDRKANISQSQVQWQDPQPLPDGLPPVPEFEPLLLPESFRDWLTDVAERYQCPLDYLAVGAMVALSGLAGTKFSVKPKRKDDWPVTPNLWGAVVGPPGVMKTPALSEAIRPLKRLEVQAQEKFKQESDQYEQDKQIFQAIKTERDKEIKKAHREGKDPSEILAKYQPPEEPKHRRYLVNDTTVEALAEILQDNPEGVCAYRDELIGLLKMLDKEGQEHSRAFYLEAWNGNDSYSSDRIGRGHVHIPQCCLSLLGGIQPGRLQSYVMEAVKGGEGDDGLIQRFQLLVWPDISRDWKDVDRWPDTQAKNRAFVAFDSLDLRPPENFSFRFDDEAQDLFIEWRTKLELKIRAGEDHPAIEAHFSKYRSLVPSLALLIALADNPHLEEKIPLGAMEQATAWAEYLEAHARRVYSAVTRGDTLAAEALAKKIREGDVEDGITLRALRRKNWSRLDDYDLLKDAVGLLEDLNWLRYEKEQSTGRPKTIIRINPSLLKKIDPPKVRTDKSDKRQGKKYDPQGYELTKVTEPPFRRFCHWLPPGGENFFGGPA